MEGWRDGCRNLEDLLGGLEDQGWCLACGVYGHTLKICPFQEEEEEEPAQVGRRSKKRRGKGKLQQQQQQPQQQKVWREVLEHPQPRREETEPFPSSEEMLDWVSDPEWNWEDLPKVVDLLWARYGEHWEHWEQHYYPVPFVNPAAVLINYLAADLGLPQQVDFQVGGATPTCTLTGLEGKCLLSPSQPAEEECLLVSPSQPAEEECLLVSPSEAEPHQSPAIGGEPHQSPAIGGDYTLLPPSSPGDYMLLPPSSPGDYTLLPPSPAGAEQPELLLPLPPSPAGAEQQELPLPPPLPPAEGECLLGPLPPVEGQCLLVSLPRPPSSPPRGEEQDLPLPPSPPGEEVQELPLPSQEKVLDAGIPQQPLHNLLRGAQRKTARPQRLRRGPAPPQPLPQWPTTAPRLVLTPAPPKDASLALPKDASLASPKDASLASPKDASLASPKDASLASPGAAWCSASPGAACCSHCLGLPVALHRSRKYCGRNPNKGSCQPQRRGRRSGDHQPQQQFRCRRSWGRSGDLLPLQHFHCQKYCGRIPTKGSCRL
ncbi:UNVERIFIED_CONTAM: hypothetical protein FKN15_055550 [Acipenser sinensis]